MKWKNVDIEQLCYLSPVSNKNWAVNVFLSGKNPQKAGQNGGQNQRPSVESFSKHTLVQSTYTPEVNK